MFLFDAGRSRGVFGDTGTLFDNLSDLSSSLALLLLTVASVILLPLSAVQASSSINYKQEFSTARTNFYQDNYQEAYDILSELEEGNPPDTLTRRIDYFLGRSLHELDKYPVRALKHFYDVYGDTTQDNLTDDALFFTADILDRQLNQKPLSKTYLATITEHFEDADYFSDARTRLNDLQESDTVESYPADEIPPPKVKLNFKEIDIRDFISTYSDLTGTNFLLPSQLSGTITLLGKEGIPLHKLFDVFLSVLESRGYTLVRKDGVYEVKQLQQALDGGVGFDRERTGLTTRFFALNNLPWDDVINAINVVLPRSKNLIRLNNLNRIMITARPSKLDEVERIISTFRVMNTEEATPAVLRYTPKHTGLSDLSTQLETLLGNYVTAEEFNILTSEGAGTLLVVLPSNKESRARSLLELIDRDADDQLIDDMAIKTFRLDYAEPSNVKQKITELLKVTPGNFASDNVKIVVDERQKALIVSTNSSTALQLVKKTINDLDSKSESIPDNVRVFPLKHANVQEVTQTLQEMKNVLPGEYPGGEIKFMSNSRRRSVIVAAESVKVFPIVEDVISQLDKPDVQQPMQHHVYKVKNSDAGPLAEKLGALFEGQEQEGEGRQLRITADEQSNSLVISASPQQWSTVKRMLNRLDKPKHQILVDVYIAEASKDLANEIGVEWNADVSISDEDVTVGPEFGLRGQRGTRFDNSGQPNNSGSISGDLFGLNAGLFEAGGTSLQAMVHALDQDEDFNLLSSSHLVSNENEEATLSVGEIIPLKTQEQQATSGQSTVVNSFEFEDVGIELSLTPSLGEDTTVTMDLEQQIEEVIGTQGAGLPTRRTRDIQTKVAVAEQNTLVLGGIVQSQEDNNYQTVPYLGQIPVLRWLFSTQSETSEQRNLLVFLRPHIISNPDEASEQTERLNENRKEQTGLESRIQHLENMIRDSNGENPSN